jgi:hypothetical protein
MKIDKTKISEILINEGKQQFYVDRLLESFPEELSDTLAPAYNQYVNDGTVSDVEIDGVSLSTLMDALRAHFFVALKQLDQLIKTPEGSADREKLKRLFTTPVHFE